MRGSIQKRILRLLCACLIFALCLPTLSGCGSRKLTPSSKATQTVGAVGDYDVLYEELYFLANSLKREGISSEELWNEVCESIVANHAILTLCDRVGVEYDKGELEDEIQDYVDGIIDSDFGSVSNYRKSLAESYMTDHYVRFTAKVDILYEKISSVLAKRGELLVNDELCEFIENNFVRTWHFMIANNKGDDPEKNLADARAALEALRAGKTNIYELIGGKYSLPNGSHNEDLLIPIDGYTFGRGSMNKAYEDAAYALEVDEYSEVILAKGQTANGEYVDCYYVIQRLPLDAEYIEKSYDKLQETYVAANVAERLQSVREELSFVPNEYALSLDLLALDPIGIGVDLTLIVIVSLCAVLVIGAVVAVILRKRYVRKKRARLLSDARRAK